MKMFSVKIIAFFIILLVLFILPHIFIKDKKNNTLLFYTNSVCTNAKMKWLDNRKKLLANSDYIIIGSSMSLNNLDPYPLVKNSNLSIINLSSWGRTIPDFFIFNRLIKDSAIYIINLSFSDLSPRKTAGTYFGYNLYPFLSKDLVGVIESLNILKKHKGYKYQQNFVKKQLKRSKNDYKSITFDDFGSVLINENIKPSKKRWNLKSPIDTNMMIIPQWIYKLSKKHEIFVFFSPERNILKTKSRFNYCQEITNLLNLQQNVHAFNLYQWDIKDSCFFDHSHFNRKGAQIYSDSVSNLINSAFSLKLNY